MAIKKYKKPIFFIVTLILLFGLFFVSIQVGTLQVTLPQLFRGIFIEYDKTVESIVDLRFPRIIVSLLAGAGLAVSGVLLQSALKNPLADPGIIGVSSGAAFMGALVILFFPQLYFFSPVISFAGGLVSFCLIYSISWKNSLSPIRIILVGVAVNALFDGLSNALSTMSGGTLSGVAALSQSNTTMLTWSDVRLLACYVVVGLIISLCLGRWCNYLLLEEKTARSVGIPITRIRIIVSLVAVLLASIVTSVVGTVSFLALIVPHCARMAVGSDHRILIPYSMLCGSLLFLLADTIGRTIAYPYEISAAIILAILGGPILIHFIKRSSKSNGN